MEENFCYPKDFFWVTKGAVKELWKITKLRTIFWVLMYVIGAVVFCTGYYLLFPFRVLHEKCEAWCYK